MNQLSIRPYVLSHLGFEKLFNELESMISNSTISRSATYPPVNVFKTGDGYTIEMAIAGFKKKEVSIEHDRAKGLLKISGKKESSAEDKGEAIQQGISTRQFQRQFTLSSDIEVNSASLEDGMLSIHLAKTIREEEKPLLIGIN